MSSSSGVSVQVEADLYSGRPNPTWIVPSELVDQANDQLARAPVFSGPLPPDPGLGYRGLRLSLPGPNGVIEVKVFGGAAECRDASGTSVLADEGRCLERQLLAAAENHIPSQLFEYLIQVTR